MHILSQTLQKWAANVFGGFWPPPSPPVGEWTITPLCESTPKKQRICAFAEWILRGWQWAGLFPERSPNTVKPPSTVLLGSAWTFSGTPPNQLGTEASLPALLHWNFGEVINSLVFQFTHELSSIVRALSGAGSYFNIFLPDSRSIVRWAPPPQNSDAWMHFIALCSLRLECKSTGISGTTLSQKLLTGSPGLCASLSQVRTRLKTQHATSLSTQPPCASSALVKTVHQRSGSGYNSRWNWLTDENTLRFADVRSVWLEYRLFRSAAGTWVNFVVPIFYLLGRSA